jgi:sugar/nucleoside kinase (ribokinase family)
MTLGSVGNDESGIWILQKLEEEKLSANILKLDNRTTGSCPVTVIEADRTCIGILEACEHYEGSHLENILANQELMSKVKYLYTTEFFLDIHQDIAFSLAKYAIENNRSLCFNLASDEDLKNY